MNYRRTRTFRALVKDFLLRVERNLKRFEPKALTEQRERRVIVNRYLGPSNALAQAWIKQRTEKDNFYYYLNQKNSGDLAALIATIVGAPPHEILGYLDEINQDDQLKKHLSQCWSKNRDRTDSNTGIGRREGWYGFIRALKPKLVIETGVHDGVGATVILSALSQNQKEGFPGRYIGTDINPSAGWLIPEHFSSLLTVMKGDSIESLKSINETIDIFINDSDHSPEYEAREYREISSRLSDTSLILGDNSHATDALRDFAWQNSRPFLLFREQPLDHWYPGGGIGVSPSIIPLRRKQS